jgi:ring-1,2-phenylacetyl-CoA epoxidase subunit PaaC
MSASITVSHDPGVQYLLRIGDTCLILAQRLGEWCGHAPMLEEDIALTNMALDLVGQARAVLTRAGELEGERGGERHDEDQLAFLRDERDFRNCTLVELPRGDFAVTVLRNLAVAIFLERLWQRLEASSDAELAAIAGKAVKEARYHREHAADWVVRLGDGTAESAARTKAALDLLWPYVAEIFEADPVDDEAAAAGLGPRWADLREAWRADFAAVLGEAGLSLPAERAFRSTGKLGRHSEHLGYVLAEMQHLQRAFPGGVW